MSGVFAVLLAVFIKLVNMSIAAGWLILAVIAMRFFLKKAPKWVSCMLWALVAVKLVCPFSFESAWSLIPSGETVKTPAHHLYIQSGINMIDTAANGYFGGHYAEGVTVWPREMLANPVNILAVIWASGAVILLAYALISCLGLRKSVGASIIVKENIMRCDEVKSPFILGLIKPVIYVPSAMDEETMALVVRHEMAHLARRDHWWKLLGYLLLTVYWFHPLVWGGYILFCRDLEMACDEKVIRSMDNAGRAAYSQALLDCSFSRRTVSVCPLAFGEVGVKKRVTSVLRYKKPARWIVITAAVICFAVAVCFLTNPKAYDQYDIKGAIVAVCHYEDLGEDTGFGKYMDTKLAQSLMDSIVPRRNIDKAYYGVKTKLLKKETSPRGIEMTYQVIRKFRYENADFDTTISEEVHIVYDCNRKLITDFRFLYPNR